MEYPFQIATLIHKAMLGTLAEEEQCQLDQWLAESEEHRQMYQKFIQAGYIDEVHKLHHMFHAEDGYNRFLNGKRHLRRRRMLKYWSAVASVAILLIGVATVFWYRFQETSIPPIQVTEVIKPGKTGALLTLSNGEQVVLSDSLNTRFKEQAADIHIKGTSLDYTSEDTGCILAYNKITTPRGGEYQLTLSDGTRVWLNAESELKYPVAFIGKTREVVLQGEAYFEVAKNAAQPFLVKAGNLGIKVLGTSFNLKSYPKETEQATLVQGKVEVNIGSYRRELQPGEQLNYASGIPEVRQVDVKAYTAWKEQRFVFNDDLLEEVTHKLGRWYDVEFILHNTAIRDLRFTGNLPKYNDLNQVLKKLELTTHIRFVQNGRTIEVYAEQ